jgi:uncharacterized protein with PIN domain
MKFIVDAMFGRLARWLRMSGYDTVYDVRLKDGRLVMRAKDEKRALITRDKDLFQRAVKHGVRASFISNLDFIEQLKQVTDEHRVVFKESPESARCPNCNSVLARVDKKDIKAELPENVEEVCDVFWICRGCGKVYWHGGHWKNIKEMVIRLRAKEK